MLGEEVVTEEQPSVTSPKCNFTCWRDAWKKPYAERSHLPILSCIPIGGCSFIFNERFLLVERNWTFG